MHTALIFCAKTLCRWLVALCIIFREIRMKKEEKFSFYLRFSFNLLLHFYSVSLTIIHEVLHFYVAFFLLLLLCIDCIIKFKSILCAEDFSFHFLYFIANQLQNQSVFPSSKNVEPKTPIPAPPFPSNT